MTHLRTGLPRWVERARRSPDNGHSAPPVVRYPESVLERVGNTPLLRLGHLTADLPPEIEIYAKAEWFNPGGSVKDRSAQHIIASAEASGELTHDKILIDSTSGNTGIAYAWIGAAKGYRVKLVMPGNVSAERIKILRAYGADLHFSDPLEGSDGAIHEVQRLIAEDPDRYFYADQYGNPANWRAHFHHTGPEIWQQTDRQVTHFVAGVGTSGTLMGVGRFLKQQDPRIQVVAVEPADELEVIEGLKHIETAIVPGIYDPTVVDRTEYVSADAAYRMAQLLARREGLFVGFSAGATLHVVIRLAREIGHGLFVTVLPDSGDKYLSLRSWD